MAGEEVRGGVVPKPCPFCGSAKTCLADNEDKEWYANTWWITCEECGARGPEQFDGVDRHDWSGSAVRRTDDECRAEAIATWNRRAPAAAQDAEGVLREALKALLPSRLCGESWDLPDNETVQITVTFGKLRAARSALAGAGEREGA